MIILNTYHIINRLQLNKGFNFTQQHLQLTMISVPKYINNAKQTNNSYGNIGKVLHKIKIAQRDPWSQPILHIQNQMCQLLQRELHWYQTLKLHKHSYFNKQHKILSAVLQHHETYCSKNRLVQKWKRTVPSMSLFGIIFETFFSLK